MFVPYCGTSMMMARKRDEGDGPRPEGPASEDSRRAQRESVEELRGKAAQRGVAWDDLLERASIPKANRSRLKDGRAGLKTLGRLRRALDELTGGGASSTRIERDSEESPVDTAAPVERSAARRWVIAQRKDRQLYFGIAASSDDEIASTGRVRLDRCRPIQSVHADAATLASTGPSDRGIAGPEVPSALVLEIAVVFDCSRAAVQAFESRK